MYYAQVRYYAPDAGRFISQDVLKGAMAVPGSLNAYAYCWNRPLALVDRDGRSPSDVHSYHENWHTQSQWEPRPPREPLPEPPDWRTPWTERPSYCEVYVGRSPDVSEWEPWTPPMTHCPTHLSTPPYYADWHLPREPLPPWQPIDYVLNAILTAGIYACAYLLFKSVKIFDRTAGAIVSGGRYTIENWDNFSWQDFLWAVGSGFATSGILGGIIPKPTAIGSALYNLLMGGGKVVFSEFWKAFRGLLFGATSANRLTLCWA